MVTDCLTKLTLYTRLHALVADNASPLQARLHATLHTITIVHHQANWQHTRQWLRSD